MTIVFSYASQFAIVMSADSAITNEFEDHVEFETANKSYPIPGIGCITTWGERVGNQIGQFLRNNPFDPNRDDVTHLASRVYDYLRNEYRPQELGLGDLGFHIAGFDRSGEPRLFHAFWGFDRPRPENQLSQKYELYDHSPERGKVDFLYNGRNDLAFVVVNTMLGQIMQGNIVRYDLRLPDGLVLFADFVVRFGAELTPEVGAPFVTQIISPANGISTIINQTFSPLDRSKIIRGFQSLGYMVVPANS